MEHLILTYRIFYIVPAFINLLLGIFNKKRKEFRRKKSMKILLLTNLKNEESKEDIWIADILKKDGNIVDISWIDYDEKLDEKYDVFIKRNIWLSDDHDYE